MAVVAPHHEIEPIGGADDIEVAVRIDIHGDQLPERPRRTRRRIGDTSGVDGCRRGRRTDAAGNGQPRRNRQEGTREQSHYVDDSAVADSSGRFSAPVGILGALPPSESTIGADGYRTFAPGDSRVSPLVLSGYVTPNRPTLSELIAEALAGKAQRAVQALITPVPPRSNNRRPRRYQDCLISKITVPGLSAAI